MTWSIELRDIDRADLDRAFRDEADLLARVGDEKEQVDHVLAALTSLVGADLLGSEPCRLTVRASGHSNGDLEPTLEEPNDAVSIFVHREKVTASAPRGRTTREARAEEKRNDALAKAEAESLLVDAATVKAEEKRQRDAADAAAQAAKSPRKPL